jgi:ABC-type lipoprotein release transport system permease subunit
MVARAALGAAAVALSSAILACVMPSLRALGGEVSDVLRVR